MELVSQKNALPTLLQFARVRKGHQSHVMCLGTCERMTRERKIIDEQGGMMSQQDMAVIQQWT